MQMVNRAFGALVLLAALLMWATGGAAAQSDALTVGAGTVVRGVEGDVVELGRIPVDRSLAGPLCTVQVSVTNQASVHPGSDILIQSGDTALVLADVEGTPDKVTTGSGSVSLTDEVVVSIRLGPDGLFSGGMTVTIDYSKCPRGATTTTSEAEPAGPTVSEPEPSTTDTAAADPTTTDTPTTGATEPAGPAVNEPEPSTTTTTETSTSVAPTTATTGPAGPTTESLPVTGSSATPILAAIGALLVLSGLGLGWVGRMSSRRA